MEIKTGQELVFRFRVKERGRCPKVGEYYTTRDTLFSNLPRYYFYEMLPHEERNYIILERDFREDI